MIRGRHFERPNANGVEFVRAIADQLPPEIARQLHPDRLRNESEYWAARQQLMAQYRGQWVGFANGVVVAAGTSPVQVLHAAEDTGKHPFFTCVGSEAEPCRIRRVAFPYDADYPGEPLPVLPVEFRLASGGAGVVLDRVIPDTGADASVLPWADCQLLQLNPAMGIQSSIGGVAGGSMASLAFSVWVSIDGQDYPCRLQADFGGHERILGRDVLNQLDILYRGPTGEVVLNP